MAVIQPYEGNSFFAASSIFSILASDNPLIIARFCIEHTRLNLNIYEADNIELGQFNCAAYH